MLEFDRIQAGVRNALSKHPGNQLLVDFQAALNEICRLNAVNIHATIGLENIVEFAKDHPGCGYTCGKMATDALNFIEGYKP